MIDKLSKFNMDTITVPDGYDLTTEPDLTRENLIMIIDKQNEIIEALNILVDKESIK